MATTSPISVVIGLAPTVARSIQLWMKRYLGIAGYGLVAATKFSDHQPFAANSMRGATSWSTMLSRSSLPWQISWRRPRRGGLRPRKLRACRTDRQRPVKAQCPSGLAAAGIERPYVVLKVRVQKGSLTTDPWQYVSLDGEVVMRTPLKLAVAVEALLVMVPPSFEDRDLANDFEPAA
jgi:hypothetical protein